jgi:hypothetical protein
MIWIWLLTRHSHKWATGPLDRYFAFLCAQCGVTTPAMVRTFGFGSGRNPMAAERSAQISADAYAYRAVTAAACPGCCALQPSMLDGFDRAAKKAARRRMLRLPIAAAAAMLAALVLAIPAARDFRHSATLGVVAVSVAAALGALFFAIFSGAVLTPSTNPSGVWFSRDPMQGPSSWFPAQPGRTPVVAQPEPLARGLSLVALAVTSVTAIVALVLWTDTFRKVYVVSAEGARGDLVVRIDGVEAGRISQTDTGSNDAPYGSYEVRTSSPHEVVVVDAEGAESKYRLDPATAKDGWVIAPHSIERGLCVASIKWYYGTTPPKDGDDALLNAKGDLAPLPHSFDYAFSQPPSTIQTQNGSSATKTSLRALDCAALEHENMVPFKNGWTRPSADR